MTKKTKNSTGLSTKLVHAGEPPDPITGAIAPLLVRTKTFRQPEFGKEAKWQYSRGKNPTRTILETKLASLLGKGTATVFGSGDAATAMFLLSLRPGDHILCCEELYGGTVRLLDQLFSDFGIKTSYIDVEDKEAVRKSITPQTKVMWIESPTNPKLGIIDLEKVSKIAKKFGLHLVMDMTFSPPCTNNPFDFGADTIIYSLSKYFGGHNDILGGAIVTLDKDIQERMEWLQWTVGAVLAPDECYRIIQELKTLEMRWKRVSETAQVVANYLKEHSAVAKVYYPGLASHPNHTIAKKQMKNGFGSVISFDLFEQSASKIKVFVDSLQKTNLIMFAESLASPETILAHPASMSHRSLTEEQRAKGKIHIGFFRLSVGFEDPKDIINALNKGLTLL
jgi:cystathionine beta-lyase/cystathionine gamma-synthase